MRDSWLCPGFKKGKKLVKGGEDRSIRHTFNKVVGELIECEIYSPTYNEKSLQVITIIGSPVKPMVGELEALEAMIIFFKKYGTIIHFHNDESMVITIRYDD